MDEILAFLCVLFFVLAIITLVGHGIWVLFAKMFGSAAKPPRPAYVARDVEVCPRCAAQFQSGETVCVVCLWPRETPAQERRGEAALALQRQVARFELLGLVSPATSAQLVEGLHESVLKLSETSPLPEEQPIDAELVDEIYVPEAEQPPEPWLQSPVAPPPVEQVLPVNAPPRDPAERARRYAERRLEAETAEVAEAAAVVESPSGARSREPVSRLMSAFLEENNIRWGELVGGLLIVCCSIALVISFWSEIADRPFLKFFVFNGVSAALFGVGFYTHHRWKIRTTSLGVLIIATLLVPLNFLAIAAFTDKSPPTDLVGLGGEALSLALFTLLCFHGAKVLVPRTPSLLTLGVMLPCLLQLLTRRFIDSAAPAGLLYLLGAAPLGSYLLALGVPLARASRKRALAERPAVQILSQLGIVAYATLLPLALLLYKSGAPIQALRRLSPLVVLFGAPALAVGLLFWRQIRRTALRNLQTAGVSVGIFGAAVIIVGVVLSWPHPPLLLATALAAALIFSYIAASYSIPAGHLPAGVCLSLVWLVAAHRLLGNWNWDAGWDTPLGAILLSAASGNILLPMAGLLFGASFAWRRTGRPDDAEWLTIVGSAVAASSLLLVTIFGFARLGDPAGATWTYAIYAVAASFAATRIRSPFIGWAASLLLLAALVQAAVFRWYAHPLLDDPWIVALLLHASLTTIGCALLTRGQTEQHGELANTWIVSALTASMLVAGLAIFQGRFIGWSASAVYWAWLAIIWLTLGCAIRLPQLFLAFQAATAIAVVCNVAKRAEDHVWYAFSPIPWRDPWFLEAVGIALAVLCLIWSVIRISLLPGRPSDTPSTDPEPKPGLAAFFQRLTDYIDTTPRTVEHGLEAGLLLLTLALATYAVVPGVGQELAPVDRALGGGRASFVAPDAVHFEAYAMPHDHATGSGMWLLLAAVAVVITVGMWQNRAGTRALGLLLCAGAGVMLLATAWEADVAVASALRWLLAGFVLVGSIPVWFRASLLPWARRCHLRFDDDVSSPSQSVSASARAILVSAACLPYLAMAIYVSASVVSRAGVPAAMRRLFDSLTIVTLVSLLAIAILELMQHTSARRSASAMFVALRRGAAPLRNVLLLIGVGPLLVTGVFIVALALKQFPLLGPEPGTWFREIGWSVSYGVPLATIALAMCGFAIRERSSRYALASGLLMNVVATIAYLLRISKLNRALDPQAWVEVAQCNCAVSALVALVWIAAIVWHRRRGAGRTESSSADPWPALLFSQVALAVALLLATLFPATAALFFHPLPMAWVASAGSIGAWIALGLTIAALVGLFVGGKKVRIIHLVGGSLVLLVAMISLTAVRFDIGDWLAYHVLLAGCVVAACAMPLLGLWMPSRGKRSATLRCAVGWSAALGAAGVLIALRALVGDPAAPWWTVAALLIVADLSILLAWLRRQRRYLWAMGVLTSMAASIAWFELQPAAGKNFFEAFVEFVLCNVAVAALTSIVSLVVERRRIATRRANRRGLQLMSFHRLATWGAILALLFTLGIGLLGDINRDSLNVNIWLQCAAIALTLLAVAACLWDPATRRPELSLYCTGFAACGLLLDSLDTSGEMFTWLATMLLACYSLLTSYLWSRRRGIQEIAARWNVPLAAPRPAVTVPRPTRRRSGSHGQGWLVAINSVWAVIVVLLVFLGVVHYEEQQQRLTTAYALLAEAIAVGFLARGTLRSSLQYGALLLGVLFAIAFGWSWLAVEMESPVLHRAVVTLVAVAAMLPIYGLGVVKLFRKPNSWTRAAQRLLPPLIALSAALLFGVLAIEVRSYFTFGDTGIAWPALVAVAVALLGLSLAALAAAVWPGRDPLNLSERGRTLYVYAAEALLGLLFLHIRLTMPWLFHGWFMQFWPLIVMGISFLGVGFSQWFHQRRQRVLAEPLENTGALLPLLPALGAWIVPSEVNYSLLLLAAAALYTMLSVLRKSFLFGVLAAVAVNGSLWHLLNSVEGWGLLEHPQLWLIPPALCVLAASYLNRERLSDRQFTLIRYQAAIVVYASSTADIFVNGVAQAPWLPAVLAGLSILGIFAGIVLRVRAFLYLGVSFLMVALFTIIWYAAVELHRTWIWWISGIVAGALIIAFFGLFEKKRDEMLRIVDELKHWEA